MWQDVELSELITRLIDYRGKTPHKTSSGVKLITAKVIKDGQILDNVEHEYIADEDFEETMRRGIPRIDDIIITTEAPLGEVAMIKTNERIALAQRIILFSPDTEKVSPHYLYYAFLTTLVQERLQAKATGTTVPGISNPNLKSTKIPLPPLPVQHRIAEILSRYDSLIENYQRQISLLEAMAQTLYREWFVYGRCPYASATEGCLPDGWRKTSIGEVCSIGRGSSPRPINDDIYFVDGTIPWIKIADATASGKFLFETKEHVNEYGASFSRYLNEGSLIIATSGTLGFCILLGVKGCVHDGWLYISEFREGVTANFMYFVINSLTEYFNNLSYGAAIQNINSDILRATPMVLPTIDILQKFQAMIDPIDKKIRNLTKQSLHLRQMRDKLLPRLMSGQLEVHS